MMIKVNGEYLDFNGDIEIESQIKLFEEIETANGDYSYSFDLSKTTNNLKILGFPFPDTIKSIYNNVPCEVIANDGLLIYTGSLQINNITDVISCTFFSGNTEWFGQLSEPMSSLPLYRYDVDLTEANILASWLEDSGIVFPIVDAGALVSRSFSNLKVEDFTAGFYIKTLFHEIFDPKGIKLEGDFIRDFIFDKAVVCSNGKSQDDIENRSCYSLKTSTQSLNGLNPAQRITFQDQSTFPYFDGSTDNLSSTGLYTADIKMRVRIEVRLDLSAACNDYYSTVRINGNIVETFVIDVCTSATWTHTGFYDLEQGDNISVYGIPEGAFSAAVTGGTFKVTPTYLYKVFGTSSVPNWSQGEFVSNILRLFNVMPSYNVTSKTLTLDLFNNIKNKPYVDISDEVVINAVDFSEFVSNYAKNNYFKYQESEDEDLRQYNVNNFISYGSGNITIDNDYLENSANIIESDFTSPITYLNGVFDMSMERINFVELDEIESKDITSVTDSSGTPQFNISNADDTFAVGDLVRIEDSTVEGYNGDLVINAVTTTYITVNGPAYSATATGTATLLRHQFTTDDNVYLFVNVVNVQNMFYSSINSMLIDNTTFTSASLAYFNLLANGRQINTKYKQSLSFGKVNNPLSYQQTILDTYWPIFSQILADPVKLFVNGYFNRNKFTALKSFLRPIRIKTNETNNLYYLNRITGYKSGHEECEAELIKL